MLKIERSLLDRFARAYAEVEGKSAEFDRCKIDPEYEEEVGHYEGYLADAESIIRLSGLDDYLAEVDGKSRAIELELFAAREALKKIGNLSILDKLVSDSPAPTMARFAEIHQHATAERPKEDVRQAYQYQDVRDLMLAAQARNWGVVNWPSNASPSTHRVVGFMIPTDECNGYWSLMDVIDALDGRFEHIGRVLPPVDVTANGSLPAVTAEMELLEGVVSAFVDDDIRRRQDGAEPYSTIPEAVWEAARAARARHAAREVLWGGRVPASEYVESDARKVALDFAYTNWRGEYAHREVVPMHLWYGESKYHDGQQWFLKALDAKSHQERDFAINDLIGRNAAQRREHVLVGRIEPIRDALLDAYYAIYGRHQLSGGVAGAINGAIAALDELQEITLSPSMVAAWKERQRQIAKEGWSAEHDDAHSAREIPMASAAYAMGAALQGVDDPFRDNVPPEFPWDAKWWKPGAPARNLEKSVALGIAELDRIARLRHALLAALPEVLHLKLTVSDEGLVAGRLRHIMEAIAKWQHRQGDGSNSHVAKIAGQIGKVIEALNLGGQITEGDGISPIWVARAVIDDLDYVELGRPVTDLGEVLGTAIAIFRVRSEQNHA